MGLDPKGEAGYGSLKTLDMLLKTPGTHIKLLLLPWDSLTHSLGPKWGLLPPPLD